MHTTPPMTKASPFTGLRLKLYTVIFEADTRAGQLFDRWLIIAILASIGL